MAAKPTITMADIARLAKVSKPTVSRALSDSPLVNAETKKHVLAVARKHGYAVNRNAQKLRHKRTNTIGVSIDFRSHRKNHISDPFMFELLAGVSEALGDQNQDLLLCAPNHNDLDSLQQILLSGGVDGFIFLGQGHRETLLSELAHAGMPIVVWGARTDATPYCVVGSDNHLGGLHAGRYFIKNNRRDIAFMGDTSFSEIYWRRTGLESAIKESSADVKLRDIPLNGFEFDSAYEATSRHLESGLEPPDALFTWSDTTATASIRAFIDAGLKVPEDVSVIGYNDIPLASYFNPPISTIRQDTYHAGKLLVSKLMQLLDGLPPTSETIKTELIIRDT